MRVNKYSYVLLPLITKWKPYISLLNLKTVLLFSKLQFLSGGNKLKQSMWPGVLGSGVRCLYFNLLHHFLFICEGFQATVLNILIKMQNDVKELKRQIEHNTAFLQSMQQGAMDDCDL